MQSNHPRQNVNEGDISEILLTSDYRRRRSSELRRKRTALILAVSRSRRRGREISRGLQNLDCRVRRRIPSPPGGQLWISVTVRNITPSARRYRRVRSVRVRHIHSAAPVKSGPPDSGYKLPETARVRIKNEVRLRLVVTRSRQFRKRPAIVDLGYRVAADIFSSIVRFWQALLMVPSRSKRLPKRCRRCS
jgi:hypothetical protein